jgi:putative ABC transport system permease protein
VLARLGRLPRVNRGLLMALRNTVRRPARFLLSVGLLASAGAVFVAGMSLSSGVAAIAEGQRAARTWDVDVQLAVPATMESVGAALAEVPGVTGVQGWHRTQGGVAGPGRIPLTRTYPDQGHGGVSVTAVPGGAGPGGRMLAGRWLEPGETGAVVLNQIARSNTVPGIGAGDRVQLYVDGRATTWRVVGIVEQREGGAGGVYTTAAGFAAAMGRPERVNTLRVTADRHDEATRRAVADAVATVLDGAGIGVASAASVSRGEAITEGHLDPVILIVLGIAVAMGLVGGIGLASTMSANVLDRIREFGVMHAIGARPRAVRRIVVAEGVFLAVTSCVVAALPALALTRVLGAGLGNLFMQAPLPYRVSTVAVIIWLAVVLLGAVLATDAAATRASRITVREALAHL